MRMIRHFFSLKPPAELLSVLELLACFFSTLGEVVMPGLVKDIASTTRLHHTSTSFGIAKLLRQKSKRLMLNHWIYSSVVPRPSGVHGAPQKLYADG